MPGKTLMAAWFDTELEQVVALGEAPRWMVVVKRQHPGAHEQSVFYLKAFDTEAKALALASTLQAHLDDPPPPRDRRQY